jgi:N-acetylglucosaminyldiphosphoundecaprenol N-acetyl-beta-D-mannosaminyltransferase
MKKMESKIQVGVGDGSQKTSDFDDTFGGNVGKIFDIPLFSGDRVRVLNIIGEKLALGTKKYWIATVNPEFVMEASKDKKFGQILNQTSLNVVDGIGLIWARELDRRSLMGDRRFLDGVKIGKEILKGNYKDEVATGADLIIDLAKMTKEKNLKMFFLGGWDKRAKMSAKYFQEKFELKDSQLAWSEGEPNVENEEVIKKINKFRPDILLVAYGMKKQEFWIVDNLENLNVGLVMGVGRSFDYYSGELKRAPRWVRKMGMEWLYSLIKEPKRWRRQLVLPKFVWKVLTK